MLTDAQSGRFARNCAHHFSMPKVWELYASGAMAETREMLAARWGCWSSITYRAVIPWE